MKGKEINTYQLRKKCINEEPKKNNPNPLPPTLSCPFINRPISNLPQASVLKPA